MRIIAIFLVFITFSIFSEEIKNISCDEIYIKYSDSKIVSVNRNINSYFSYTFFSSKSDSFKVEVFNKLNNEKIITLVLEKSFYFNLKFDDRSNKVIIKDLLGEVNITAYNSFFDSVIEFDNFKITNFYSNYRTISLPRSFLFIEVLGGKIKIQQQREPLILITGEKCETSNDSISISNIDDFETAKIIMFSKFKAKYKRAELNFIEKIFY